MFLIKVHLEKDCFLALWEDFVYQLGCAAPSHEFHQWADLIQKAAGQYAEVTYAPFALHIVEIHPKKTKQNLTFSALQADTSPNPWSLKVPSLV